MKKILLFVIFILSFSAALNAQNLSVSTSNISASPGDTISVPFNAAGFVNVGSLFIKMQYDTTVLKWLGQPVIDPLLSGANIVDSAGIVTLQWVGQSALNITSGTLANIKFIYLNGDSQLTFLQTQSVITDPLGSPLNTIYTNGSVTVKNYTLTVNKAGNGSGNIKVNGVLHPLPYSAIFPGKSKVTLEAVPAQNSTFVSWGGDVTGTDNPVTVNMNKDKNVSVNFGIKAVQYSLTINKTGNGQIKVNDTLRVLPYTHQYNAGTQVKLEAVPDTGSSFAGWSGDLTGNTNPVFVTIDTNKTINANFSAVLYSFTINKSGNGQVKVNDTLRALPFTHNYPSGTQVKIEAIPDQGSMFTGWSGSFIGTTNPVIIGMNSNKNIVANFKLVQFSLTITHGGNGSGEIKINGVLQPLPYSGQFNSGEQILLEAVPSAGNQFTGWTGDLISSTNPVTITVNNDMAVTANFEIIKYTLTIAAGGNGSGKIKIDGILQNLPFTALYNYNTNVTIEAVPDSSSKFVNWSGDLTGAVNPSVVTMISNKAIMVNFNIIQYTLTIDKGGNGQVKVNGTLVTLPYSALYNSGTKITLEAVPDNNNKFTGWSGDLTGNTNPASVTMDKDRVITALFDVNIFSLTISKTGNGSGQVRVNGTLKELPYAGTFSFGAQVTLEAVPSTGNIFNGWGGDLSGATNPVTITIDGSKNITIGLNIITYTLTINKSGEGSGQIKVNGDLSNLPYSGSFNYGSDVSLEAVAGNGSSFANWSGDLSGNKNPNTISINGNKNLTVAFSINAPDMPVLSYPGNNFKYMPIPLSLKWAAVSNAVSYQFQLATDSIFSRIVVNDSNLTNPGITISSIQYKTKYFWRIRAKNSGGYSSFTTSWSFTTKIETIGCPSDLLAQIATASGKIELKWRDNATNEEGFQIFRKNGDSSSTKPYVNIGTVGKDVTIYEDQYLTAGEIYTYLVYAFNNDTISCVSNQSSIQAITSVSDKQLPGKFELFQNYPNPFNPATNIVFDIPSEMNVTLKVYDMLGREIAVLVDNEVKSQGRYTIHFDGSRFTSGEYFYVIRAGENTSAKKFVLLK